MFINQARINKIKPHKNAIELIINIFFKKPKSSKNKYPSVRPDIDNYLKTILDVGNGIFWIDDGIIIGVDIKTRYDEENNYFTIQIEENIK